MAIPKKDLEIYVEKLELDKGVFTGESTRIADFKIVYPRPTVAQKVTTKSLAVKDGKCAKIESKRWIDTILFKEGVQGDFGLEIAISSPVSSKELESVAASTASTLVKLLGDMAADAVGIKALKSFVDLPANALAKAVSGASYSAKTDAAGSLDIAGDVYAGLKSGEDTTLAVSLLAERDIVKEKHRSDKSRSSVVTRKTIAKKGSVIGAVTLRLRAL